MADEVLWHCGATDLSVLTRASEVTGVEAVQSAVDRMRAVNPSLDVVVCRSR